MSKITLKEFRDLTDLFATYYSQKSDNREDGWIEKTFQKYPALKNIWKDFDKKIKDIEDKLKGNLTDDEINKFKNLKHINFCNNKLVQSYMKKSSILVAPSIW